MKQVLRLDNYGKLYIENGNAWEYVGDKMMLTEDDDGELSYIDSESGEIVYVQLSDCSVDY